MIPLEVLLPDKDILEIARGQPCACGRSPRGAPQKIVDEVRRSASLTELMSTQIMARCDMQCQACKHTHPFQCRIVIPERIMS